jgi:hypothetical protein
VSAQPEVSVAGAIVKDTKADGLTGRQPLGTGARSIAGPGLWQGLMSGPSQGLFEQRDQWSTLGATDMYGLGVKPYLSCSPAVEQVPFAINEGEPSSYLRYFVGNPREYTRPASPLEDAEAWSSILHLHSSDLPSAFTPTCPTLTERVQIREQPPTQWLPSVKGYLCVANAREKLTEAASNSTPEFLAAVRRHLAALTREYEQIDRDRQLRELEETAAIQARLRAPAGLLEELALTRGLSWHTIAGMIAVTPTAIRKWRRGTSLTGDNRQQLASLVAFFDLLERTDNPPQDIGSWVEMPVSKDSTLTPAAIYRAPGGSWLLLEWVRGALDTVSLLDRHDPAWRSATAPDAGFQVGIGPDGERAIIPR